MKLLEADVKKFKGKILKIKLENGNFLRGRFMDAVRLEEGHAIVIQSNTYTFQIDDKDISELTVIAENVF